MTAGSVVLLARIEVQPASRRELLLATLHWAAATRREPGAVSVSVNENVEQAGVYWVISTWQDSADLERHLSSADFSVLLGAIEVLSVRSELDVIGAGGAADARSLIRRARRSLES